MTRPIHALLLAAMLALASTPQAKPAKAVPAAKPVQGLISKVTDGDTLWITPADGKAVEVRLRDIDAPELCQPWGEDAHKALAELALNKVATLQASGKDSAGRTIGTVLIEDLNLSRFMVENGHAWSLRTKWDQGPLVKQEKMARALTRGLHSQAGAVQPWEWRRRLGGGCPAGAAAPAASAVPVKR
jgi:endonuclease YncB( thermonuclease family)